MKIVEQKVQHIVQVPSSYEDTIKHIEEVGRICYQSADRITVDSAEKFCLKLFKLGHMAMIEHSWTVLKFKEADMDDQFLLEQMFDNRFIDVLRGPGGDVFVTGNWRAFIENFGEEGNVEFMLDMPYAILDNLETSFPEVFNCEVLEMDEIPKSLRAYTVVVKTDRAVTHELVRHRPCSFAQESQRYCAYKKNVEYIEPYMYAGTKTDEDPLVAKAYNVWRSHLQVVTDLYRKLMSFGEKPQEARSILPNCTATQIAITADMDEWNIIFGLRTSPAAYPQVKILMGWVKETFIQRDYM